MSVYIITAVVFGVAIALIPIGAANKPPGFWGLRVLVLGALLFVISGSIAWFSDMEMREFLVITTMDGAHGTLASAYMFMIGGIGRLVIKGVKE